MKYLFKGSLLILALSVSFVSCRNVEDDEDKTEVERLMDDPDNKVEVKDGGDKIKIETAEGDEIKIKKDDGEYKKKVDRADGSESKVKIDDGEVKVKTDN
ncbi:hypothetical protein [Christiangramia forsetii]|uniref:Membrane or secreted protein n=2 Tax=Christiangramia forsetii TaxID=411153 RepID=A0M017_CHRFK|nr:hypothetical protein [Christiangramia forsetii]GGG45880.1 hypothetical protein GCM10011532_32280 [Christiangramia forsetii]CAL65962.1 membrane or secreted protein [Christiangramia forsetii KT0803]